MDVKVFTSENLGNGIIGIVFIGAGVLHFVSPRFYLAIMPPYLPYHRELVYLSGIAEIIGGIGVLFPRYRKWAGIWLILTMIAVFPANIYMAMNPEKFRKLPTWGLYARIPLQFVIIGLIYWLTIHKSSK